VGVLPQATLVEGDSPTRRALARKCAAERVDLPRIRLRPKAGFGGQERER